MLNAIASEDAKDSTSAPVRIADFTSKIGQDIKGMKIALPKEYLGEGINPEVKETILNAAKHFEKLGAIVEEVSLPHSKYGVAVYYIIASSEASSNLQRFDGIRYGYRAEDATNLDEIYVNSRSQGFGEEVKRRIMLVLSVFHQVTTMPTIRRLDRSVHLSFKISKKSSRITI